jgi:hypothetical protein
VEAEITPEPADAEREAILAVLKAAADRAESAWSLTARQAAVEREPVPSSHS